MMICSSRIELSQTKPKQAAKTKASDKVQHGICLPDGNWPNTLGSLRPIFTYLAKSDSSIEFSLVATTQTQNYPSM